MSTSLAAQLAGIRANNNATILDKSKRKKIHGVSLVYEPKEAVNQDFESIYYDCLEAFRELETVDHRFSAFSNSLFSETSIRFDRLVQSAEQSSALNHAIEQFLMLIAGYFHLSLSFRALEWLVRRFQIQIHNVEALLLAALPWHEAEQFVRILDIVNVSNFPQIFQFLQISKQNLQGPSKASLVRMFTRDSQLYHAVNAFELKVIKGGYSYDRQLVFWSSSNIFVAMAYKEQGEANEATDLLLPLVSDVVPQTAHASAQVAAYMILAVVSTQFPLGVDVLEAATDTIVSRWAPEAIRKGLLCVSQLAGTNPELEKAFSRSTWDSLVESFEGLTGLVHEVLTASTTHDVGPLVQRIILSTMKWSAAEFPDIIALVRELQLSDDSQRAILEYVLKAGPFDPDMTTAFSEVVELVAEGLSEAELDRLELALQSSIKRPHAAENGGESAPTETEDALSDETPALATKQGIIDEASNLEQSTQRSFLTAPLPQTDPRAQLWVRAAGIGFDSDELKQLARVSSEAELSFVLAIAIGPWPTVSRVAAIRLGAANIKATISGNPTSVNFQAVLPIALFLLSDPERRVRSEAISLVRSLTKSNSTSSSTKWNEQPGFLWLGKNDFQHVVRRLSETLEESILDRDYVFSAIRQAGKAAWSEFLVSHALTTRIPQILWVTLKALSSFKGVVKQLAGLYLEWNKSQTQQLWQQLSKDARFPLSGVEKALIQAVRSNDATGINFLIEVMKTREEAVAQIAGDHIVDIWGEVLKPESQDRIAEALVEIAVDDTVKYDSGDVLQRLQPFSAALFTQLLDRSRTEKPLFNEATAKRRRRRSSSAVQLRDGPRNEIAAAAEHHLRRTTVVLELLERTAPELRDIAGIIAVLFDILEELMTLGQDSGLPVLYTEELLANCMISLVESLKTQEVQPRELSPLKVSVVVSCIRTSSSPQVQNRLLLLVAALATLCPDVVLHSVMPIFTFMGANTVRLDNDFSAHVIQKTIEQVIPALVAYGDKQEEIEMALMSFVAAFPHVPRHRRNKLFGALIKTLGADQSLYKLLLLLGQRYAEALAAKRTADAKAVVHFTTPFLRSFAVGDQLLAMSNYIKFITDPDPDNLDSRFGLMKIRDALENSSKLRNALFEFLVKTAGAADVIAGTQPLRSQISRLSNEEWSLCTGVIGTLLRESVPAAKEMLVKSLELLPIDRFIEVVIPLITPTNDRVLALVSSKFEYESVDDRIALEASRMMVLHLTSMLDETPSSQIIEALDTICLRFGSHLKEEELKLLESLCGESGILNMDVDLILSAILCINTVSQHLGAAMFGFFPRIFPVLFDKVQRVQNDTREAEDEEGDAVMHSDDDESEELELAVFALFAGFVRQMPRFMAPEAPRILELVFASRISPSPRERLLDTLEQKIDAHSLLAAFSRSWEFVLRGGLTSVGLFFTSLGSVIERSSKKEVASVATDLSHLLISCLSTRETVTSDLNFVNQVEAHATDDALAVVMKLNDRLFRPQFVRIVQWGFEGRSSAQSPARQIPFLKFVNKLFSHLKGIVTNYFGYIIDNCCELLEQPDADATVKKLILQAFIVSFTYDQDDFWQSPSRFDQVLNVLLQQLTADTMTHGPLVVKALTALALVSSAQHRKRINDGLAQFIVASAPVQQKLWTVKVLSSLYRKLGEDWVANLPQLVPLIAELLDDEDETVELETRRSLVPVIEGVMGESLDRYLA